MRNSIINTNSAIIQKFLMIGRHSSELLLALVEDVLNLSKMESNMFVLNISDFDVRDLVNEVADMFEYQWKGKKLELIIDIDSEIDNLLLKSDRGRIKQTLINLLANSYKFTYIGSISIIVRCAKFGDEIAAEFSVRDTGIGISKEDEGKLFKLFGMLKDKDKINPNGCGIGLTVSKKYIEMLKGEIHLTSKVDEGTTITFTIPKLIDNLSMRIEEKKERQWR
jgi:signal transduction histidine kinase